MTERIVVTGGAGFIGSHLVRRLLNDGHHVRVIDNLSTGNQANLQGLHGEFEFYNVSTTDLDTLRPIFHGVDTVFHEAALPSVPRSINDPITTHGSNLTGTLNVLIASRDANVRRVVYAGSSSAYGDTKEELKSEEMSPHPKSPYGVAKLGGEYYCQAFNSVYGLETVCLRYFNVFGPRQDPASQYSAVIPLFITLMLNGKPPTIQGDGLQSRDFTYIDNVVHGNLLAAQTPRAVGEVINLAAGGRIQLLELVEKINRTLGTFIDPIHVDERSGDIRHSRANIDKARTLMDYEPIVDFDEGLTRTIEWYKGL